MLARAVGCGGPCTKVQLSFGIWSRFECVDTRAFLDPRESFGGPTTLAVGPPPLRDRPSHLALHGSGDLVVMFRRFAQRLPVFVVCGPVCD